MKQQVRNAFSAVALLSLIAVGGHTAAAADTLNDSRLKAAAILGSVLDASSDTDQASLDRLSVATSEAAKVLGTDSYMARSLQTARAEALAAGSGDQDVALATLRGRITEAKQMLEFKPIKEAEMPESFPAPTPVGEVELKRYPAYRMAQTEADSRSSFWTLFRHIKQNKIAMTAPVQMGYSSSDGEANRQQSMAFLYGSTQMGSPGSEGAVQVLDVAPMSVVSTGVRGRRTAASLAAAQERLQTWLKEHRESYRADGEVRVMGYNSPFVPASRSYFEVQIPLRQVSAETAAGVASGS